MMKALSPHALIVAELSANHGNDLNLALETVDAFADAGADALKVQTFRPQSLCMNIDNPYFGRRKGGLWKGRTLWDIYNEAALPYEWHAPIQNRCEERGIEFFSSPFDLEAVDFLIELGVARFKIASMEINHLPLIRRVAETGHPVIISTGLAETTDIHRALVCCHDAGNGNITLLKCTSSYPAQLDEANLVTMTDMATRFNVAVGVSDHTLGTAVAVTSAALGASVIEKHVVLDRTLNTLDSDFSLEPDEFAEMVSQVRAVESALGTIDYDVSEEGKLRRRSVFVVKSIKAGELVTDKVVQVLRPGHGADPESLDSFLGLRAKRNISAGTPACLADFE